MEYEKIWKKTLNPNEQVEYEFSVGKKYRIFFATLGCLGGMVLLFTPGYYVGILVAAISVFYFWFYQKWANAYAFTNKRIVAYRGWLSTDLISIDYDKITDVTVEEPILDKLLTHTGNLIVNTAGVGFPELKQNQKFEHIENPYEAKKKLDEIRSNIKNK